ncbi:MLL4 [Mytilus coruscus]|uniref:MLL4 n=1 Tax=Mytilus coruscus TaxID=42192 RepID=A0A6J8AAV6_MYTCO|nr:MLL4 [Mytilus coruscus]
MGNNLCHKFIDELSKIASQMSNAVDYKHLNTKIKEQCDILLSSINNVHNSSVVVNTKINSSKTVTNACNNDIRNPEECLKCKRKSLSRSVWCSKGNHWIHYHCEKLKSEMINILENNLDTNHYICSLCDIDSIDDKQVLSVNSPTEAQLCNSNNLPLVNMVNEENEIETETLVKQYIKHLPTIDKNCK